MLNFSWDYTIFILLISYLLCTHMKCVLLSRRHLWIILEPDYTIATHNDAAFACFFLHIARKGKGGIAGIPSMTHRERETRLIIEIKPCNCDTCDSVRFKIRCHRGERERERSSPMLTQWIAQLNWISNFFKIIVTDTRLVLHPLFLAVSLHSCE